MQQFNSKSHQYDSSKAFQELLSPRLFHRRQQNGGGTIVQRVLQQQQFQQMFQQYQLQQQLQQQQQNESATTVFSNSCDDTLGQSSGDAAHSGDSSQTLLQHPSPSIDTTVDNHNNDESPLPVAGAAIGSAADAVHQRHYLRPPHSASQHHPLLHQHLQQQHHNQQQQHFAAVSRASSVRSAPLRPSRYESSSLPRMGVSGGGVGVGVNSSNNNRCEGVGAAGNNNHNGRVLTAAGAPFAILPPSIVVPTTAARGNSNGGTETATTTVVVPSASVSMEQQLHHHHLAANGDFFPANMQLRVEWTEQQRRRLYRIALNFFNKTPDLGVQLLVTWGFVRNSPRELATLFMERRGISKQMIGEYLGTLRSQFHTSVLNCFMELISMYDMDIDVALRQLLKHIRLPLEAQKIDHIIQAFAQHYVASNRNRLCALDTPDAMYILAFAVIMLNTDLHTPSLKDSRRMKLDEFVQNLYRLEEARHMDRNMLASLYERVKQVEFQAGTDHVTQVLKVDQSIPAKEKPKLVEPHRRLICYCRLHQLIDPNKRQSATAHQREIFLFNDLMLVCKLVSVGRRKSNGGLGQYQLRYATPLIGLHVKEFQNSNYSNGLMISCADGQVLMFNAKNGDDRFRFIADIRESVAESTEMEQWRRWSWSWTNSSNRSTPLSADGSSNE